MHYQSLFVVIKRIIVRVAQDSTRRNVSGLARSVRYPILNGHEKTYGYVRDSVGPNIWLRRSFVAFFHSPQNMFHLVEVVF